MATEVAAPDGARWRVRRRWLGGRALPRWRGSRPGDIGDSVFDLLGAGGDSVLGAIASSSSRLW
ncbi:hypothetical protein [Conexibacter woesei]|uniref:hypothetical protein n=1 Tax=Conexibacter woesei TaxID=191495 RepID=UPI00040D5AB9|nr:hypothetical protein [Conexibacter woesei]